MRRMIIVLVAATGMARGACLLDFEDGKTPHTAWDTTAGHFRIVEKSDSLAGNRSLEIDTCGMDDRKWLWLLRSKPARVPVRPGARYELSFRMVIDRIETPERANPRLIVGMRNMESDQLYSTGMYKENHPSGAEFRHTVRFTLPSEGEWQIQFAIRGKMRLRLDDVCFEELAPLDLDGVATVPAASGDFMPYGVITQLDNTKTYPDKAAVERHLGLMASAGMQWIRVSARWHRFEPRDTGMTDPATRYDAVQRERFHDILAAARAAGLRVYFLVYGIPDWARIPAGLDAKRSADWESFVRFLVNEYGASVDFWEIGLEANAFYWEGTVENYIEYFRTGAKAVRAGGDPGDRIILSGAVGDGVRLGCAFKNECEEHFFEKMYRAGLKDLFDIVSVHPFAVGGEDAHAGLFVRFQIETINAACEVLERCGDPDKPVWVGATSYPLDGSKPDGGQVLENTYRILAQHPRVQKIFWFQSDGRTSAEVVPSGLTVPGKNPPVLREAAERFAKMPKVPPTRREINPKITQ